MSNETREPDNPIVVEPGPDDIADVNPELDMQDDDWTPGEPLYYHSVLTEPEPEQPPTKANAFQWGLLTAAELEHELLLLNAWVNWLRIEFALPAAVVPPLWHRHRPLLQELSALHLYHRHSYATTAQLTQPLAWMKEFAAAQGRLREWVNIIGTKLDRDRPMRQTTWPGEEPWDDPQEYKVTDREADFKAFVTEAVLRREALDRADEEIRRGPGG